MTILFYMPFINKRLGGVPAFISTLSRDLGALCDLHVISHKSDDDYVLDNCTVHYISNKWYPWTSGKRDFLNLLKDINPDVFHTNACWLPLTALTAIWAKDAGYKVVYTPHGQLLPRAIKHHYWKKLPALFLYQRRGVRCADVIHVTSEDDKKNMLQLGWNKSMYLIPNCIQIDQVKIKSDWNLKKKILFLSRIKQSKGVHHLIEAVDELKKELNGYEVVVAGPKENSYYDEMVSLVRERDLTDIISFPGPVYDEQKWRLYTDADIFILPTYTENFGICIAEALACGTPVITTKGAPWEDLITKNCGWWVELGTEPLKTAIKEFLRCEVATLKTKGQNGRLFIETTYSSSAVAKQFIEMYKTVLMK